MPVPKKRKTHSKVKMQRANKHIAVSNRSTCSNCHEPKLPHRVCPNCGYYKSKQILEIKEE
ncbi:MAG: 50S ribosomal protein L32 [bacterium]